MQSEVYEFVTFLIMHFSPKMYFFNLENIDSPTTEYDNLILLEVNFVLLEENYLYSPAREFYSFEWETHFLEGVSHSLKGKS